MLDWIKFKNEDGSFNYPKKSGMYLGAFGDISNPEEVVYTVVDFYKKGDDFVLQTPNSKMPEEVRNGSAEEKILWVIQNDIKKCPEDGFYEIDEGRFWKITNMVYWAEITNNPFFGK